MGGLTTSGRSLMGGTAQSTTNPLMSVRDFQQSGGKVAFISLKHPAAKDNHSNFDPQEARLFKIKRFGSTSSTADRDQRTHIISNKTFGIRDDSISKN